MNGKRWLAWLMALLMVFGCAAALAEGTENQSVGVQEVQSEGDALVDAYLTQVAAAQKDPWVKAILEAGARDVSWEGHTATFHLRSFDPKLKELGAYAKAADPAAWRAAALTNMAAYDLQVSLTFEEDGSVGKKQANSFLSAVKSAASSAKGSAAKKDMKEVYTALLYCAPSAEKTVTAEGLANPSLDFQVFVAAHAEVLSGEAASWAPLFYLQRNWQYNTSKGPHAITLSWDAANPSGFLDQVYDSLTATLAGMPGSQRPAESSLAGLWDTELREAAIKAKKGRLTTQKITLDLDDLIAGRFPEAYAAYFRGYTPDSHLERLIEGYRQMPEVAAQAMPKSGAISQAKKGRGVFFKVPKDGRNTYIQLRDADTGVIHAEGFLRPGDNVTLKVPEGVYIVQYATGSTWYGLEDTFGPMGSYVASDEFIVAKTKWNLVAGAEQAGITLHPITAADLAATEDKSIHIQGTLSATVPLQESYPANHPVVSGVSSITGLPSSGEAYTPVVMVLDNAEDAYPHWGVAQADILFQVPNAGSGATKLLALFADQYPAQAGPVRSGRSSMLPAALSFNAAFAFAGPPAVSGGNVDILEMMDSFGMSRTHRVYNLLNSNGYGERVKAANSHNLSCHIQAIHENLMAKEVSFEERPFLFTDEPRATGETANIIRVLHRGEDPTAASNSASRAVFKYHPETGDYTRTNSSGIYTDRATGETIHFANVIIIRAQMSYDRNYIFFKDFMAGSGCAEIFQNGKYIRGAWVRQDMYSRLILVDENGEELQMQRGKTFIVLTNDVTDVIYSE